MYIRGGYNVYPLEVENVLTEHPSIAGAAVVGAQRSVIGEIGVAFVVLLPGTPVPSPDSLRAWVAERLADYKAPDEVRVVEALPLTAMGKVDKVPSPRPVSRPAADREHGYRRHRFPLCVPTLPRPSASRRWRW